MRFDIITANKNILDSSLNNGLISRARKSGLIEVFVHDLHDYAKGKHRQIDDIPYGGGSGMVLKPEPIFRCIDRLLNQNKYDEIIYFTPQGKQLKQKSINKFSLKNAFLLICGHYKGIDERVIEKYVTMEISIGDYVISCGDFAALIFIDSVSRLIPGVLHDGESALTDSFQIETGFSYPVYTRPREYDSMKVPDVLLSGNHDEIKMWREKISRKKFKKRKK